MTSPMGYTDSWTAAFSTNWLEENCLGEKYLGEDPGQELESPKRSLGLVLLRSQIKPPFSIFSSKKWIISVILSGKLWKRKNNLAFSCDLNNKKIVTIKRSQLPQLSARCLFYFAYVKCPAHLHIQDMRIRAAIMGLSNFVTFVDFFLFFSTFLKKDKSVTRPVLTAWLFFGCKKM